MLAGIPSPGEQRRKTPQQHDRCKGHPCQQRNQEDVLDLIAALLAVEAPLRRSARSCY